MSERTQLWSAEVDPLGIERLGPHSGFASAKAGSATPPVLNGIRRAQPEGSTLPPLAQAPGDPLVFRRLQAISLALSTALEGAEADAFRAEVVHALRTIGEQESASRADFVLASNSAVELTSLLDPGALQPVLMGFIAGLPDALQARLREQLPW